MTYATQTDLEERFGTAEIAQLTDRTGGVAINVTVVDRALFDADGEIDKYLGVRYTLPLVAPFPPVLTRIAADLARYWLYDDKAPDEVRTRYEDAIANLRRIAKGEEVLLGVTGLGTGATATPGRPRVSAPAKELTEARLERRVSNAYPPRTATSLEP